VVICISAYFSYPSGSQQCFCPLRLINSSPGAHAVADRNFDYQPQSPSVASVTSVRCFSVEPIPRTNAHAVTDRILVTHPISPSVASVTSVRCFSVAPDSRTNAHAATDRILATHPNSPSVASVTSVRCFSVAPDFSPRGPRCHRQNFVHPPPIPLCGLLLLSSSSRTEAISPTEELSPFSQVRW
jgi:hypothetical protein